MAPPESLRNVRRERPFGKEVESARCRNVSAQTTKSALESDPVLNPTTTGRCARASVVAVISVQAATAALGDSGLHPAAA